jgi:hypothetical protein
VKHTVSNAGNAHSLRNVLPALCISACLLYTLSCCHLCALFRTLPISVRNPQQLAQPLRRWRAQTLNHSTAQTINLSHPPTDNMVFSRVHTQLRLATPFLAYLFLRKHSSSVVGAIRSKTAIPARRSSRSCERISLSAYAYCLELFGSSFIRSSKN